MWQEVNNWLVIVWTLVWEDITPCAMGVSDFPRSVRRRGCTRTGLYACGDNGSRLGSLPLLRDFFVRRLIRSRG
jgi:hypothetical protein